MSTELTIAQQAEQALAFTTTKAELMALADNSSRITAITNTIGYQECHAARMALKTTRIAIQARGKDAREDAVKFQKAIIAKERELVDLIEPEEKRLQELQDAVDQAKAREKAAKEEAERQRVAAINARFDAIKAMPLRCVNATVAQIDEVIREAEAIAPSPFPADMEAAAKYTLTGVIASLQTARENRIAHDAEQDRIAAERVELDRLRAENAAIKAEADRLAAIERDRLAAEARRVEDAARAEREAAETAAREARAIEQARIDADRAEKRKQEDADRAAAAEALRKQQAEAVAAIKAARESEIANASLFAAACDAVTFLRAKGYGDELITLKLAAAINREPQALAA